MKWSILITLAVACLSFRTLPQPDVLAYQVTLNHQEATLRQILHDISNQYQVKFAYLNNEMPEGPTFSIQVRDRALRLVLDELLTDTGISYRVVNGQVVLKREPNIVPVAQPARSGETRYQPTEAAASQDATASKSPDSKNHRTPSPATPVRQARSLPLPVKVPTKRTAATNSLQNQRTNRVPPVVPIRIEVEDAATVQYPLGDTATVDTATVDTATVDTAARSSDPVASGTLQEARPASKEANSVAGRTNQFGQKISENIRRAMDKLFQKPSVDSSDYLRRPFHIGLVYPLSTNGLQAGRTVNRLSFHLLAGYAAGLDGAEFTAIGNIENDFVEGAQFAGFFNLVRRRVNGLQAAGFVNANGGSMRGAQLSGFVNVAVGTINGLQATGFVNVGTGRQQGAQLSGFVNLLTDSIRGAQLSGFVNYTRHLQGLQATGFVNVVSGDVRGVQLAGFVNYAHHVKGAQIGLLNIADSIEGVPIGLLSIVRKNGYRRLELWYGDALQANAAFKMGVPKFYNMLLFGTQFTDTDLQWGVGYGVGSMFPITSAFNINLDVFAMQIHENSQDFFDAYVLNLLNTVRLSFNLQLAKHLTLWAAPTFNVMVSEYQQPDSQTVGSTIAPAWTNYNRTFNDQTNVKMWPGFQVGLRF